MKKVLITMIVSVIVMMSLVSRGVAEMSFDEPAPQDCSSATPDESCRICVSGCSSDPSTGVTTKTTVQKYTKCSSDKTTFSCECTPSYKFYCTSGYYGNPQTMGDKCTECPKNATCVGEVVAYCGAVGTTDFTCDSDYYKNGTGCTACPDNATCDGGEVFTCDSDYYKNETGCTACPKNATCNGVDFTCDDGFLKEETKCSKCPAGTYFENDQCNPCPSGTYRTDEMDECETCPVNATCDGGVDFECVDYSTITPDKKSCLCNPGYYPYNKSCRACASGTYKSEAGNIPCTPCDVPYEDVNVTTNSVAATSKTQCKIASTANLEDDTGYYSYYPDGCSYGE